ncbi:MAG: argininosuccinate synthase [Planctomycetes bacterium]|nr:argininosuccinate synthase [Planctomycetota bacterium]
MRVLLAYSGGLDTSYLVAWLTRERGCEVTALTVDCGGFDQDDKLAIAARAVALGAVAHRFVDSRREMFDRVLRWLIAANVRRGGVYPLCVGAERGLQAEMLARVARENDFRAVVHGCTAAGNDQVRFEAALSTIAPGLEVWAPVRDARVSREAERAWLLEHDLPVPAAGGRYSINAGLWGLTIGGGELHDSSLSLPEDVWQWTRGGHGEKIVKLRFEEGVPVEMDGKTYDAVTLVERINREAGRLGVGRGYHLGDTVIGIKGRIAFEAPAAEVLIAAHRELEKLVLTEEQRFWKDHLGEVYGRRLHQGLFHDPFQRDLEAFFTSSQARVSGEVTLRLRHGAVLVEGVSSPYSLMSASDAKYGEMVGTGMSPQGALGLAHALARPARLHLRAGALAAGEATS